MIDREKVIEELQLLRDFLMSEERKAFKENNNSAVNVLMHYRNIVIDAIALLKEQEPRVMTLDELTEIYVEFKGDNCPIRLTNFDLQKIVKHMVDGVCRLWTSKPTYEHRKAEKWE